jgi:hypothetical protein
MSVEDTRLAAEVGSIRELNLYLISGWTLILSYVEHSCDTQSPRFVIAWQRDDEPNIPELLDNVELEELKKQMYR